MRDVLAWVATVEILGLASLPLLRAFFRNRRDAALLSRPLGLALAAYAGWALSVLLRGSFDRATLLAGVGALGVASYIVHRKTASGGAREPLWGPEEKLAAILFWSSTAVFLLIRGALPEILGQEKFMDLAFLNSLTRNPAMPPADPWMAGRSINYYYWGYLLAAALAKISGVATLVSYNLAIATFAGYSFVGAACLALRLSDGKLAAGVWAGVATVFAGNFAGALDAWNAPLGKGFNYWSASRVIGLDSTTHEYTTINEFPFFTFFQADLHPHLLAFPFFVAAFAVGHRFVQAGTPSAQAAAERWFSYQLDALPFYLVAAALFFSIPFNFVTAIAIALISYFALRDRRKGWLGRFSPMLLLAVTAGTAIAANKWNQPALGVLLLFACAFRDRQGRQLPGPGRALSGAVLAAVLFVAAINLWRPYWFSFQLPEAHVLRTTQTSGLLELLGVWGLLFAAALAGLWPRPAGEERVERRESLVLAAGAAGSLLVALLAQMPALTLLLFLAWLGLREARRKFQEPEDPGDFFALFLFLLSLAMIAGCELVYFKDNYGDKLQRMNTIFKFYHQAWPLLAIAVAVFAVRVWREGAQHRLALQVALGITALLALLYPFDALLSRLRQTEGGFSLDAQTSLVRRNPGDAAAIDWLQKNAPLGCVVMEATGDAYSEYARISTHTGIPTVLGWANHEGLWRSNDPEVLERASHIRAFYSASNPSICLNILQKYHVNYVVVGDLERQTYPSAPSVESLPFLAPVLTGRTTLYRVYGVP